MKFCEVCNEEMKQRANEHENLWIKRKYCSRDCFLKKFKAQTFQNYDPTRKERVQQNTTHQAHQS